MSGLIHSLGRLVLALAHYAGGVAVLAGATVRAAFVTGPRWALVARQVQEVGYRSQAVVIITGAFTGAVFTAQSFFQFRALGMESAVGALVSVALCRELGPVLAGLILAGRVGAAMSAEIGTMKVTEQIDALRALAVYPEDYLVLPRALAMLVSVPLLAAECMGFGIVAGYVVAIGVLDVQGPYYLDYMVTWTRPKDIFMGLTKATVFGLLIVFISCYEGLNAREGAVGVGRATTEAVVVASLAILVSNFFLTLALNIVFPTGQNW